MYEVDKEAYLRLEHALGLIGTVLFELGVVTAARHALDKAPHEVAAHDERHGIEEQGYPREIPRRQHLYI